MKARRAGLDEGRHAELGGGLEPAARGELSAGPSQGRVRLQEVTQDLRDRLGQPGGDNIDLSNATHDIQHATHYIRQASYSTRCIQQRMQRSGSLCGMEVRSTF